MADRRASRTLRPGHHTGVVWDALHTVLAERLAATGLAALDVLDVGGGTGGLAVPLAGLGHRVTVVDPSPDALASLERRAGEAGVAVRALQGDAAGLVELVGAERADLVLCHGVLEHVDDLVSALEAVLAVLRHGGTLSVLAANRNAVVLARAIAGHFTQARHALEDPSGRWGDTDPLPRRFTEAGLVDLLTRAGFSVGAVHGVRSFTDLVPGALVDHEPGALQALHALEAATADRADFRAIATQLHVLAGSP